ncbi:MAG: GNAT family N-acetyltransferase [Anaerolineales bacterium]
MPKIDVRPSVAADLDQILAIEAHYTTQYAWQIELQKDEDGLITAFFRQNRLPRSIRVEYPRTKEIMIADWSRCDGILVGLMEENIIGYIVLSLQKAPQTSWVTDLVVHRRVRRQGVGGVLLLAAQDWSRTKGANRMVLEMQSKNYPAIQMAKKFGFDFCGFQDLYYHNRDLALFFCRSI